MPSSFVICWDANSSSRLPRRWEEPTARRQKAGPAAKRRAGAGPAAKRRRYTAGPAQESRAGMRTPRRCHAAVRKGAGTAESVRECKTLPCVTYCKRCRDEPETSTMANIAIVFVGPLGQVYFWALVSLTPGRVRKEKLFCSRQDDGKERAWIIDHLVKILDIYIHVYGKLSTLFVCKYLYVYIFIFMYIYVYIVWARYRT